MEKRRIHYVLSTHWDREWYQPFQDFRYRLVQLIDRVLEGWNSGKLVGPFQTDGQAIIIEDYLEIKPEKQVEIKRLAKEGKLVIGPWYVLPDEFIVSGESLIRNLILGRKTAREFGGTPSSAGFVCDIFGHNSQMPQIFEGFGIKSAFLFRGTNEINKRVIKWRGANGSEVLLYRFGGNGYCDYALTMRKFGLPSSDFSIDKAVVNFDSFVQKEIDKTDVDSILLFDGCDHMEWDPKAYTVLLEKMEQEESPYQIKHTSLDAYLNDVIPQMDRLTKTVEGELREAGYYPGEVDTQWLIPGVLSSRVWIKQKNAACQTMLTQWAEPFSTLSHVLLGRSYPQGYLNTAWKWLLANHAHDSICGCSIDAVHEDMMYRFRQSYQIADRVTFEETQKLAANIKGNLDENELRVVVFNPLPIPIDEVTEITVHIPNTWNTFNEFFGFEPKPAFRIYDTEGKEIPYQRLTQEVNRTYVKFNGVPIKTWDIRISLPLQVPAVGYTCLRIREGETAHPIRYPQVPGLATSECSMANEFFEVIIEKNGSITVHDKRNDQVYERWLTFEDSVDIGDGWFHGMAANEQVFATTAAHASVALVHNSPLLATFRIRTTFILPEEFDFAAMKRSDRFDGLVIESFVSLRKGTTRIEVETKIHNSIGDHRLRVLFPSKAQTDHYYTDTPFDVVERRITLPKDNYLYRELSVETQPQQSWSAIYDGQRGLAVVSPGILEVAVQDLPERILALTLFRSTRRTVMTDGEPLGQLQGDLSFKYWIIPMSQSPDWSGLFLSGQQCSAGFRTIQLDKELVGNYQDETLIPSNLSLLKIDGSTGAKVVITSIQQTSYGIEVRMFNPHIEPVQAIITLANQVKARKIIQVDFERNQIKSLGNIVDRKAVIGLNPKQILTVVLSQ